MNSTVDQNYIKSATNELATTLRPKNHPFDGQWRGSNVGSIGCMASREEDLLAALNELISSLKTTAKQDPQAFQIYLEAKWLRTCVENNNVHLPDWQLGIVGALKDGFIIRHPQSSEHLKRVAALVEKLE